MKELDETKKYNIKNLSDKELLEVIEWLRKNDRGWKYVNLADLAGEKTLYFDGGEWMTSLELEYGEVNAKELFYTLENVQVDCRELSEDQIEKVSDIYHKNKIIPILTIDGYLAHNRSFILTTITYDKFMELFINKEENFKKLVEVLNEELTEESFKEITNSIADLLIYKNQKYGNSALNPLDIFNGKTKVGQRIDDKLARVKNSKELRKNDIADLLGYLTLVCQENNWTNFDEFKD